MDILFSVLDHLNASTPFWWVLALAAFLTSALTSAVGIGGGVMLVAVMSSIFPPAILIPVHAIAQLGSGFSRVYFLRKFIHWHAWLPLGLGTILGISLGSQVVVSLPENVLRVVLAVAILLMCWMPKFPRIAEGISQAKKYFTLTFVSGLLSMFIGSTGPLVKAGLGRDITDKKALVGTFSTCITFQNFLKILAFGALGFSFSTYLGVVILMVVCAFVGGSIGVFFLDKFPERFFKITYKTIITLLAIQLFLKGLELI